MEDNVLSFPLSKSHQDAPLMQWLKWHPHCTSPDVHLWGQWLVSCSVPDSVSWPRGRRQIPPSLSAVTHLVVLWRHSVIIFHKRHIIHRMYFAVRAICHYMYASILLLSHPLFFFPPCRCLFLFIRLCHHHPDNHHHHHLHLQRHRMPTQMQTLLILMRSGALLGRQVVSLPHLKPHSNPQTQVEPNPNLSVTVYTHTHALMLNAHLS